MDKSEIYQQKFIKPIVFWGSFTCLLVAGLAFLPPLYLWIVHGAVPPVRAILAGSIAVIGFSGVFWFVEPPSYFPILGIPGTYMSFLSGNISNMRVPCSALAQEAAGVEEGSEEGSILSTIGIGASVFINLIILTIGAIAGIKLVAMFPPLVKAAFSFILPTVFGGVFGQFASRNYKLAGAALVLCMIMALLKAYIPLWVIIPICVFGTIFIGVKMFNSQMNNDETEGEETIKEIR